MSFLSMQTISFHGKDVDAEGFKARDEVRRLMLYFREGKDG